MTSITLQISSILTKTRFIQKHLDIYFGFCYTIPVDSNCESQDNETQIGASSMEPVFTNVRIAQEVLAKLDAASPAPAGQAFVRRWTAEDALRQLLKMPARGATVRKGKGKGK